MDKDEDKLCFGSSLFHQSNKEKKKEKKKPSNHQPISKKMGKGNVKEKRAAQSDNLEYRISTSPLSIPFSRRFQSSFQQAMTIL